MLHLLLAAAVSTVSVSAASRDTTLATLTVATPTVRRTPIVGVKGILAADSIVVEKAKHTLTLYLAGFPVRTYGVALGKEPTGDKVRIGDNRTPEGLFRIDFKNPQSKYHMALHISYPDAAHIQRARALGVATGGDIMIHGLPPAFKDYGAAHRETDWTEGCIAVTDQEIEEIWRAVPAGAPIQIKP
jgi:murein L,D-transpeptidase YafK